MPDQPAYPGVEVDGTSGSEAIPGVPTSITAFVGRTRRGPTDRVVAVTSYGEFERFYGGLWEHSALPSSVRDFFANGGTTALVVRLHRPETGDGARPARARLVVGTLELEAADEGEWGNALRARIDHDPPPAEGPAGEPRFTLSVRDDTTGTIEVFPGLSVSSADARFVTAVVAAAQSRLVRVTSAGEARPAATAGPADGAVDVWADTTPPTNVTVADGARATDGQILDDDSFVASGLEADERGLYLLEQADLVNLLVIPPYTAEGAVGTAVVAAAAAYCEERRAVLLVDPSPAWQTLTDVLAADTDGFENTVGTTSSNAALFFPRLRRSSPAPSESPETATPSGAVAGVIARTDDERGVWHSPAGIGATLAGVDGVAVALSDGDIGRLTPIGVNALRVLPGAGPVVWGSRTLHRGDADPEWTYLPVRRLALFIEESLDRGTRWAVFEPNDEALWARIRLDIDGFLAVLFRQGAFQGPTPQAAYFVRCDRTTTSQTDVDRGIVNVVIGFAPLRPAEFVVVRLQQLAGQPGDGCG